MLSDYLAAFTTASKRAPGTVYLDLFAGDGTSVRSSTGHDEKGSARRALEIEPRFSRVVLFETPRNVERLKQNFAAETGDSRLKFVQGDCNETIHAELERLRNGPLMRAATFAFIDPYSTVGLKWGTLRALSDHKRKYPYKVELWILFYGSDIPRILGHEGTDAISRLDGLFGSAVWRPLVEARRSGDWEASRFRDELTNLLRWQLEHELKYKHTHSFRVTDMTGHYLYDLVFATDNAAGNRIMGDVYAKAAGTFEVMRREELLRLRELKSGQLSIFGAAEMAKLGLLSLPVYSHQPPWRPFGMA
jgi:three-Cys-motif partner protein